MRPTVLIPCHRRTDLLRLALDAVREHPVLVVDDSADGLSLGSVACIRTTGSVGFSRAVNQGLAALEEQDVLHALLLNDDAQPEPGCIQALVAAWTEQDDGALAPVLVDTAGGLSTGFVVSRTGRVRVRAGDLEVPTEVDAVSGAAMLIRTRERLDEGYRHGFEDLELCRRLKARGLAVRTIPQARCRHAGGATVSRQSRFAQRTAVAGHMRYLGGGWRSGVAVALSVGQVLLEGGSPSRMLGVLDGWRDHRRGAQPSEGVPSRAARAWAASMAGPRPGSRSTR